MLAITITLKGETSVNKEFRTTHFSWGQHHAVKYQLVSPAGKQQAIGKQQAASNWQAAGNGPAASTAALYN